MTKLSDKLETLILMATKQAGSYDPNESLFYIVEELTREEHDTAEAFLGWVHADRDARHFGHGNIQDMFHKFRISTGQAIDVTPTWTALMPALLAALTNGTKKGKDMARAELMRLASEVDKANKEGR